MLSKKKLILKLLEHEHAKDALSILSACEADYLNSLEPEEKLELVTFTVEELLKNTKISPVHLKAKIKTVQ